MTVLLLTLVLQSCENFARHLQATGTADAAYHDICTMAVDADIPGAYQFSRCVREADGGVVCNFWTFGTRRLPFEPQQRTKQ